MEERTRLGRGLEEISQLYLSDRPRETSGREHKPEPAPRQRRVTRIIHPGSRMLKSCFLANLSLELSKCQVPVVVWDDAARENIGTGSMLGKVLSEDLNPDAGTVRLYGLPDILVYQGDSGSSERLEALAQDLMGSGRGPGIFMSINDTIESVIQGGIMFDAVLLSGIDESSLLRAYAFIKVIWERDPSAGISIVFHEPGSADRAQDMFSRLSGFVKGRLSGELGFLGHLAHDDLLDRSMEERKPIVLWHEQSESKDSITAVSTAFLLSQRSRFSGEGA